MDPIREEKLQAMNMYNYNKSQFLNNLLLYSFTVLTCSLFCFYPYWFPSLCSSMNHFLFISLPNASSFFFNPKCLFIVGNAIVIFLIGESKFSSSQSPVSEIYDEYVERSRSHTGVVLLPSSSTLKEKKEEKNLIEESVNRVEEVKEEKEKEEEEKEEEEGEGEGGEEEEEEEEGEGEGEGGEGEEDDDDDNKERDGEEESGLPVEELNKRVEEFIARVNKQRWLEAKSFISL